MIRTARAYDPPDPNEGCRVLVDRVWPRGIRKDELCIEIWLKELAPSTALRKWFNHDPAKWNRFKERYFAELDRHQPEAVAHLLSLCHKGTVTLVFGSKEKSLNNAEALKIYLEKYTSC